MNYYDIINQAIELVVVDAGNGLSFLEPRYKEALRIAGLLDHEEVIAPEELFEAVKLEVEKRNTINNQMNVIAAWIAKTIETVIDPAITQEENELMKNLLAYLVGCPLDLFVGVRFLRHACPPCFSIPEMGL